MIWKYWIRKDCEFGGNESWILPLLRRWDISRTWINVRWGCNVGSKREVKSVEQRPSFWCPAVVSWGLEDAIWTDISIIVKSFVHDTDRKCQEIDQKLLPASRVQLALAQSREAERQDYNCKYLTRKMKIKHAMRSLCTQVAGEGAGEGRARRWSCKKLRVWNSREVGGPGGEHMFSVVTRRWDRIICCGHRVPLPSGWSSELPKHAPSPSRTVTPSWSWAGHFLHAACPLKIKGPCDGLIKIFLLYGCLNGYVDHFGFILGLTE